MNKKVILKRVVVVAFSTAMFIDTGIAYAFDMCKNIFNMMNQSKSRQSEWRSNYRDRGDHYGSPEVRSVYGYGPPGYGYGAPPALGYGYTVPSYAAPPPGINALQAEIYQLNLQIRNLEKALIHESSHEQSAPTDTGTNRRLDGMSSS
jgi:hypothetical protein